MKNDNLHIGDSWTDWDKIENARENEKGYYGIYRIRLSDIANRPFRAKRLNGNDEEGIIYIGRARPMYSLAKRVGQFQKMANEVKGNHSGAETFSLTRMILETTFGNNSCNNLEYSVIHMNDNNPLTNSGETDKLKKEIEEKEIEVLAQYFSKYAELPPCNSSMTGKWGRLYEIVNQYWKSNVAVG
jgi:hypothetical protein